MIFGYLCEAVNMKAKVFAELFLETKTNIYYHCFIHLAHSNEIDVLMGL